ncbi:MAG: hypothetical protein K2O34_07255 [Acetatifactor sp.]|nr:hypothetical protein [Acetatifactor sp.]
MKSEEETKNNVAVKRKSRRNNCAELAPFDKEELLPILYPQGRSGCTQI